MQQNSVTKKRTRSGCEACKARHRKCDESRPSCTNCQKHGVICPGFDKALKWREPRRPGKRPAQSYPSPATDNTTRTNNNPPTWSDSGFFGSSELASHAGDWHSIFDELLYDVPTQAATSPKPSTISISSDASDEIMPNGSAPSNQTSLTPMSSEDHPEASDLLSSLTGQNVDEYVAGLGVANTSTSGGLMPMLTASSMEITSLRPQCSSSNYPNTLPSIFVSIPREIPYTSSILLSYYFQQVCAVGCLYDGPTNPFRTVVSARWQHSLLTFTAAQGAAGAAIASRTPELKPVAMLARNEALKALETELRAALTSDLSRLNEVMFTLLLIGISCPWLTPGDRGLQLYTAACSIMELRAQREHTGTSAFNNAFFEQAMTYWWMLLCFIVDPEEVRLSLPPHLDVGRTLAPTSATCEQSRLPHPWAGISTDAQILLGQVVSHAQARRGRAKQAASTKVATSSIEDAVEDLRSVMIARNLEQRALALKVPDQGEIIDPLDPETQVHDLTATNAAYRSAILILIYRTFPMLPPRNGDAQASHTQFPGMNNPEGMTPVGDFGGDPLTHGSRDSFQMAIHVLETLSCFKTNSRILGGAPHLLLLAASELRVTPVPARGDLLKAQLDLPICSFRFAPTSIADLRRFVLDYIDRLIQYFFFMHLERMRACVLDMWRRMDSGLTEENGASWIDVMRKGEWEVLLG